MRYLVNIPLIGSVLLGWTLFHMTILTTPPRGGDAGLGFAYGLVFTIAFFLIAFVITVIGCALTGGFDWLPVEGGGARFLVVLLGFAAIIAAWLLPIGIAMETAGRLQDERWSPAVILASRVIGFGLPLLLLAYMAWVINASDEIRYATAPRHAALGLIGIFAFGAAAVSAQELMRWNRLDVAKQAAEKAEEDEKAVAHRRAFEALTDADPLLKWYEYTSYASPEDIRLEAMRRVAARPRIDVELIGVLGSENPLWAAEGVRFVDQLAITPSPALADAVRKRLDTYAKDLGDGAKIVTYDGDKRLDYYEQSKLRDALAAARKLAKTANADLRGQIDALKQAVALYPKSDTARVFPREADEAKKEIAATLAKRS